MKDYTLLSIIFISFVVQVNTYGLPWRDTTQAMILKNSIIIVSFVTCAVSFKVLKRRMLQEEENEDSGDMS